MLHAVAINMDQDIFWDRKKTMCDYEWLQTLIRDNVARLMGFHRERWSVNSLREE
jgi:hypothetical protein